MRRAEQGDIDMRSTSNPVRMRRWAAFVTAGALAVTVAACGGDDQEAADTTAAAVETTAAAVETTAAAVETTAAAVETTAAPAEDCGEPGDKGEINVFLIPSPSSTAIQSFIPA
ncbi:MAG: hypothetical protein KGR47_15820, partial [Acidobacteria bacterium]|nr:hypothetical protein [Acidobacteriota bacterium]